MKNLVLLLVLTLSAPVLTMAHSGDEQLYAAVQKRDKAKAEMLLKKKDDLNSIKQAGPWMNVIRMTTAVSNANVGLVKLLIANQVQIDWRDGFKATALMHAASTGNKETVELLTASGADVNATDGKGNTVLTAAKENENDEAIALIESNLRT